MTDSAEDILHRVTALLPLVESSRARIASDRRLPDELVNALRGAGAFRMPMPEAWGGPEMTPRQQTEVVERLATADPSTAWCVMIGSDAGYYSAFMDDDAAHELFADVDAIVAGWIVPAGRAEVVDGGYRVSGHWSFGSCCLHADVIAGGCLVFDGDTMVTAASGMPEMRIVLAPASSWTIQDTWHTTGLAGSGSNDYETKDLFVPRAHTFSLQDPPHRDGALYRFPGAFFANMHGVPLGLARRAIDEVKAIAQDKVLMPEMVAMRDVPRVRTAVAKAEMALRSARAFTYANLDAVWEHLQTNDELTIELRVDLALARVNAFRMAREVAQAMVDTAGTQAIYRTSILDTLLRDAITMNQHIVAQDRMLEMVGGMALGVVPALPFI